MSNTSLLGSYGGQAGDGLFFRNRILNGCMRIDQRNSGAALNPAVDSGYGVDRWKYQAYTAGKLSMQQNAGGITPPAGFTNYLGFTSLSAYTVLAADYFLFSQFIEGFNVADFNWGTANAQSVSVSFWVRSSLTGTFGGAIENNAGNRSYPFTYSINSANTWEQKTITIPGDTSGTWLTNNSTGLVLRFSLGSGSNASGPAGAWSSTRYFAPTGATSVVGTSGATFYITGVQLEAGPTATPFERRPFGTELSLCQRYYEQIPLRYFGGIYVAATNRFICTQPAFFKATKRIAGLQYSIVAGSGTAYWADSNQIFSATSNTGFNFTGDEFSMQYFQIRQAGGTTPGDNKFVFLENYPSVAVNAEL